MPAVTSWATAECRALKENNTPEVIFLLPELCPRVPAISALLLVLLRGP